jgi:DNA-binding transcriptional ArsR family regulator
LIVPPGRAGVQPRRLEVLSRKVAEAYAACFRSLADATRIQILTLLAHRDSPMPVSEIVAEMKVGQSTVSHHLKILHEAGFLFVEKRGASSLFRMNPACIRYFPTAADVVRGPADPEPRAVAS